jgi:hypothetical protein
MTLHVSNPEMLNASESTPDKGLGGENRRPGRYITSRRGASKTIQRK